MFRTTSENKRNLGKIDSEHYPLAYFCFLNKSAPIMIPLATGQSLDQTRDIYVGHPDDENNCLLNHLELFISADVKRNTKDEQKLLQSLP